MAAVACLDEPTRRQLYDLVSRAPGPVGRDEAAARLGIARSTAAFHLDRLAAHGLVEVAFARRTGRTGPGAGRPAKLYRRARTEVAVSLPGRRYPLAGRVLAGAFEEVAAASSREEPSQVLARHAHEEGVALGRAGGDLGTVLEECGYEPRASLDDNETGLVLANCPFDEMVSDHAQLVCAMNLHLLEGLLDGLGERRYTARLDPGPGRCCVRLVRAPGADAAPSADGQDSRGARSP